MNKFVDGVGKPIGIGDLFLYKGKYSWRYGILKGISLRYGQYTYHVIMAQKYHTGEEYHYMNLGLITLNNVYQTNDIPEKAKHDLRHLVIG